MNVKQDYKTVIVALREAADHLKASLKNLREMSQITPVVSSIETSVSAEEKLDGSIASMDLASVDTSGADKQLGALKTKQNLMPEEIAVRDLLIKVQVDQEALIKAANSVELVVADKVLKDDTVTLIHAQEVLAAKQLTLTGKDQPAQADQVPQKGQAGGTPNV